MDDLIEALMIIKKYSNERYPTWCCHDELHIACDEEAVSDEDKERLGELGFMEYSDGGFFSFRFGSC